MNVECKPTVTVIGAGKMGLPLACQLANHGAKVVACDVNEKTVELINQGLCPFDEPGVPELLMRLVSEGALLASSNLEEHISRSEVIIIIVPVLLTENQNADLNTITKVTKQIAKSMKSGVMISYETTLPVGTTRKLGNILEESGFKAGTDFDLVFSPERVKSQKVLKHLSDTPKIVGGVNSKSALRGEKFYSTFLQAPIINVETLENAEFSKIAGMIYRDVNIALSNELSRYASFLGLDIQQVIGSANTDGEAHLLSPGIGVGGHCTPVYPYFYIQHALTLGLDPLLPLAARKINDDQALHFVDRAKQFFGDLREVSATILGLGFRPEVKEHTLSSAFLIQKALEDEDCYPKLVDPLYTDNEMSELGFRPGLVEGELIILNTAHSQFLNLDWRILFSKGTRAVVDGRNALNKTEIESFGIKYIGL
jgi:nucleotide sugar dehydrogenase